MVAIIKSAVLHPDQDVTTLDIVGNADRALISSWNQLAPTRVDRCLHHVIQDQVALHPDADAVCAWDGNLSYARLDQLSSRLAHHLSTALKVGPETCVLVSLERSRWTLVAWLAVLKAGGTFVPLDPALPLKRVEEIASRSQATIALVDASVEVPTSINNVFCLSEEALDSLPAAENTPLETIVQPDNLAYIIFTSGSTGIPKGVAIEHATVSSSALAHGQAMNIDANSRVFHFASASFDASIAEVLTTLSRGGCVCIPSESQRLDDTVAAMNQLQVNWAFFTPSLAATIRPQDVPLLKCLVLGGEAMMPKNIADWAGHVRLFNGYGPTETCVFAVSAEMDAEPSKASVLGRAIGSVAWIVDADAPLASTLVPIGALGELVIQGPIVGRGYLHDEEMTGKVFLPPSAAPLKGQHGERLYRTGDLVRYQHDGSLVFAGRKGSQVKIRGQRIELDEVAHQVSTLWERAGRVVPDVITVHDRAQQGKMLIAFVHVSVPESADEHGESSTTEAAAVSTQPSWLAPTWTEFQAELVALRSKMLETVPKYMIPQAIIPVRHHPLTLTGKLDRRSLHDWVSALPAEELAEYGQARAEKREPETETEKRIQGLWEAILQLPAGSVGADDDFFQLGGDSIDAMKLVATAAADEAGGIKLTVRQVFDKPRLSVLAADVEESIQRGTHATMTASVATRPFSLLSRDDEAQEPNHWLDNLKAEAANQCDIDQDSIEDIYPCTALQQGLMALAAKEPGVYMAQHIFRLAPGADVKRLQAALQHTVTQNDILRTRIVYIDGRDPLQVVLNDSAVVSNNAPSLAEFLEQDKKQHMSYGKTLSRMSLVHIGTDDNEDNREVYFVWTAQHAIYDGWSVGLVRYLIDEAYQQGPYAASTLSLTPFSSFIKHLVIADGPDGQSSDDYWRLQLGDWSGSPFPKLPTATHQPRTNQCLRKSFPLPASFTGTTLASILRAAWAVVVSHQTGSEDVVFGSTISGRNAPVANIAQMVGPTITTVPLRLRLEPTLTVVEFLQKVQQTGTEMIAFEQAGLHKIQSLSADALEACQFHSLLAVQPSGTHGNGDDGQSSEAAVLIPQAEGVNLTGFHTYPLVVECQPGSDGTVDVEIMFDDAVLAEWEVELLLEQFFHATTQLTTSDGAQRVMGNVETFSPRDEALVRSWNAKVPEAIESCMHHQFEEQVRQRPDATAISSWDGDLTYHELDTLANMLAAQLMDLGVGPECFVPICFEKSLWAVVAMLAVLKAGGACVPMVPQHPDGRLAGIIEDTGASLVLVSESLKARFAEFAQRPIAVGASTMQWTGKINDLGTVDRPCSSVKPNNLAFVIYTSGSTGKPKGVLLEHRSLATSITVHGEALALKPTSRVLQFSAFNFDASIQDIFSTLAHGGTICMPSEDTRLDDIPRVINEMGVNWTFLTPTVAGLVAPQDVPGLKALTLGGEAATPSVVKQWCDAVVLNNCYGLSEDSIHTTWMACTDAQAGRSTIGRPLGRNLWVADIADFNRPAPVGAIGELLVQGPTLARGYLNREAQTAEKFPLSPAWVANMSPGPQQQRVYRTGDLVRYTQTGELCYIGRKDAQVKVRGQRVELIEIEHQLNADERVEAGLVLFPKKGPLTGKVTAVLSLIRHRDDQVGDENSKGDALGAEQAADVVIAKNGIQLLQGTRLAMARLQALKARQALANLLPSFMIPTAWLAVDSIPHTVSGKLDRLQISHWVADLDEDTARESLQGFNDDDSGLGPHQGPMANASTPAEQILQEACAQILGLDVGKVSMARSFLSHGGDSITAMQLVSHCRTQQLRVKVQDVLRSSTLSQLAMRAGSLEESKVSREEKFDEAFSLSPIQQMFFGLGTDVIEARYNQSFFVRITRRKDILEVAHAIEVLVGQHSMLRASFEIDEEKGDWQQTMSASIQGAFEFNVHDVPQKQAAARMTSIMADTQSRINPRTGPIFAADLFEIDGETADLTTDSVAPAAGQVLFLVAHHLVVDMVSWRVIIHQLQELLETGRLTSEKPVPFQVWNELQKNYAEKELTPTVALPFALPPHDLGFWGLQDERNAWGDVDSVAFTVDQATTSLLLGDCNTAFNTEPIDLFTTALLYSFHQVFPERDLPTIYSEGHGREPWDEDIDIGDTVGWFTTLRPIAVQAPDKNEEDAHSDDNKDILKMLRQAKDQRHATPSNGWAYFASRFLHHQGREVFGTDGGAAEIIFNYLGRFQQIERDDSLLQQEPRVSGPEAADMGPDTPRLAAIDVSASISEGQAAINISFNNKTRYPERITEWSTRFRDVLVGLSKRLPGRSRQYTISDLPLLRLTQPSLEHLTQKQLPAVGVRDIDEVEDIYPASPIQHGMLVSMNKVSGHYDTAFAFEALSQISTVSVSRLESAWQAVVNRHAMLRTVFIKEGVTSSGLYTQVVLKHVDASIIRTKANTVQGDDAALTKKRPNLGPPHQLTIHETEDGRIECSLEISHALIDGASIQLLFGELSLAYGGLLPDRNGPLYRDYIAYLSAQGEDATVSYWKECLEGLEPCHFPRLADTKSDAAAESPPQLRTIDLDTTGLAQDVQAFCEANDVTVSNVVHAAWAILLSVYTGSEDVCFGYLTSGRDIPVQGVEAIIGPFINVLTARLAVQAGSTMKKMVVASKEAYMQSLAHQNFSLAKVQHELGLSGQALFNTILSIQTRTMGGGKVEDVQEPELYFRSIGGHDPTEVS